jgi:universal stress protein E
VPVLLTKQNEWGKPLVVMAAFDLYSKDVTATLYRQILNCAASLAGQMAGDLQVIHSYIPVALQAAVAGDKPGLTRESMEAVQAEDSFRCGQIEKIANEYGVNSGRVHIEMGKPEDRLAGFAGKYHTDVMVMGASSHGGWHRILVGSTASTLLESLPCDMLVVRPEQCHGHIGAFRDRTDKYLGRP